MRLSLLLLVFITCKSLAAQKNDVIHLELRRVSLDKEKLPVRVVEVIDATGSNGTIGIGHKGLTNRQRPIVIKRGIKLGLTALFTYSTEVVGKPEVILKIKGLRVDEFIKPNGGSGRLQLEAEMFASLADGTYRRVGPLTYGSLRNEFDVTGGHKYALVRALEELVSNLGKELEENRSPQPVTEAEMRKVDYVYPIEQPMTESLPNGVYATYFDFRSRQPDSNNVFMVVDKKIAMERNDTIWLAVAYDRPDDMKRKESRQFWGCHYEGRDYVLLNSYLFEIKPTASGELIAGLPENLYKQEAGAEKVVVTALFGVLGALTVRGDEGDIIPYVFDPLTGQFTKADPAPVVTNNMMLYSSTFSSDKVQLKVKLPDGTQWQLAPDTYIIMPTNGEVCYGTDADEKEKCEMIKVDPNEEVTLWTFKVNNKGKVKLYWDGDAAAERVFRAVRLNEMKEAVLIKGR